MQIQLAGLPPPTASTQLRLATHSGNFHADDVFAVAAVQLALQPEYQVEVLRTRAPAAIAGADIRIDVGGEYCPERLCFDHHQRGGAGARSTGVPYAAIGLVWRWLGTRLVQKLSPGLDPEQASAVASRVDLALIQAIDAVDCGMPGSRSQADIALIISGFNPTWLEPGVSREERFGLALSLARDVLRNVVMSETAAACGATVVAQAVLAAREGMLRLPAPGLPWQAAACSVPELKYALYPAEDGVWLLQGAPVAPGSFEHRGNIPAAWHGLRDAEFRLVTGVPDALFCHPTGFLCGAKSLEGALSLAALLES